MRKFLALLTAFASPALAQTPAGTINAPIYATGYISQGGGTNVTTKIPAQSNHPTNLNIYLTSAVTGTWTIQLPNPAFEGQVLSFNCGSSASAIAVTSTDGSSLDSSIPTNCNGNSGFVVQFDQRSNIWRNLGSNTTVLAGVTVNNNTQLTTLPSTISVATRFGYAAAGDAPPVLYTRSNSVCSLNAGAGDGGSQIPTSDGKCWIGKLPEPVDVRIFGAQGDGSTDDSNAIANAVAYGKDIYLPSGRTYIVSRPIQLGSGQNLFGYGAALKRAAQISTTTTTSINPSVYTITVANASGFSVGQHIAILNGSTFSTNVPITGISGNNITVGVNFGVTVSGTTTVYLSFYTIISNGGKVVGVEIDGNASSYSFYRWQNTVEVRSTGSNNVVENCYIHDAPGEAIEESVAANVPTSIGNRYVKNIIKTVNGNGIHLSGSIGTLIEGNHIESTNLQGSTMGHNGGNITFSVQNRDARIINNYLASGRAGVGQCYDTNCAGARIEGNIIRNASVYAIEVISGNNNSAFLNVTVRGNKFYDSATATFTFTKSLSTVTPTGTTVSGSDVITSVSSLSNVGVGGASISGTGIPANSIILATDGVNKIYLGNRSGASVNATASGSGVTLTITGQSPFNLAITDNIFVKTLLTVNNSAGVQIENNTFDYNAGDTGNSTLIISGLTDANIVGNNFQNVGTGIYATGVLTNVTIANNSLNKIYGTSLYMDAGTYTNVLLNGNSISNDSSASASAVGIIANSTMSVINNSINLNKGTAGVLISANSMFVSNNYINKGAATDTVKIYGGFSNCVVVNNKLNGSAVSDGGTGDTVTPNY